MTKDQVILLAAHLDRCVGCRLEYHRLQYAVGAPSEQALDLGLLAQMKTAMRQFESSACETGRTSDPLKLKVASLIAPYLGGQATQSVLQPVTDGGENLLSSVEPVLALFLGRRAAARLVSSVVDQALVRA